MGSPSSQQYIHPAVLLKLKQFIFQQNLKNKASNTHLKEQIAWYKAQNDYQHKLLQHLLQSPNSILSKRTTYPLSMPQYHGHVLYLHSMSQMLFQLLTIHNIYQEQIKSLLIIIQLLPMHSQLAEYLSTLHHHSHSFGLSSLPSIVSHENSHESELLLHSPAHKRPRMHNIGDDCDLKSQNENGSSGNLAESGDDIDNLKSLSISSNTRASLSYNMVHNILSSYTHSLFGRNGIDFYGQYHTKSSDSSTHPNLDKTQPMTPESIETISNITTHMMAHFISSPLQQFPHQHQVFSQLSQYDPNLSSCFESLLTTISKVSDTLYDIDCILFEIYSNLLSSNVYLAIAAVTSVCTFFTTHLRKATCTDPQNNHACDDDGENDLNHDMLFSCRMIQVDQDITHEEHFSHDLDDTFSNCNDIDDYQTDVHTPNPAVLSPLSFLFNQNMNSMTENESSQVIYSSNVEQIPPDPVEHVSVGGGSQNNHQVFFPFSHQQRVHCDDLTTIDLYQLNNQFSPSPFSSSWCLRLFECAVTIFCQHLTIQQRIMFPSTTLIPIQYTVSHLVKYVPQPGIPNQALQASQIIQFYNSHTFIQPLHDTVPHQQDHLSVNQHKISKSDHNQIILPTTFLDSLQQLLQSSIHILSHKDYYSADDVITLKKISNTIAQLSSFLFPNAQITSLPFVDIKGSFSRDNEVKSLDQLYERFSFSSTSE